jgi:hypothetical protein
MSNTQLPTAPESLRILEEAVELGQSKGIYSIKDAVFIATALEVLKNIHPQPNTEQNKKEATKSEAN